MFMMHTGLVDEYGGKLKETTGLDVRKPTESPALYLAYSIAEELISENYDLSLLLRGTK